MDNHKLGIIVPYRDRYEQLQKFKVAIKKYLNQKNIDYELIIVEQDSARTFNRGKLLNIGFIYAKKLKCDYVVFHDIDMLPINVNYSYSDIPIHLATNLLGTGGFKRIVFDEYFGGVTLFPNDHFESINGYSNNYWGWGYEDTDLLYRCKINKIPIDSKEIEISSGGNAALKFNGVNAYVKSKNIINLRDNVTIFISFCPDELVLNEWKDEDIMAAFAIQGYDFRICYNSYSRYTFEIFDDSGDIIYIDSNIVTNYKTNICVTIDNVNKKIKVYQDGQIIGDSTFERLHNYTKEKNFYLGCVNPEREGKENYFRGIIDSFAVFNDVLTEPEVIEISKNRFFGLTQNFGNYKSDYKLITYYDAKFIKGYKLIDLSGNENHGEIVNCEIIPYEYSNNKIIDVPFRRLSTFQLLPHEENGYVLNGWKDKTTRYNQLRFYNEVSKGYINTKEDGLNNCEFKEHGNSRVDNYSHIVVGI